jgi:hypothetical protein
MALPGQTVLEAGPETSAEIGVGGRCLRTASTSRVRSCAHVSPSAGNATVRYITGRSALSPLRAIGRGARRRCLGPHPEFAIGRECVVEELLGVGAIAGSVTGA